MAVMGVPRLSLVAVVSGDNIKPHEIAPGGKGM